MTAGVVDGGRATVGRAERIGTAAIVTGAAKRLWAGGWRTLALWAAIAAIGWGLQAGAAAGGVNIAGTAPGPGYFAYLLASALLSGVGAALALRLFVRGPAGWLTFDRGLLLGAAAMAGVTLAFAGMSQISVAMSKSGNQALVIGGGVGFAFVYLGAVFVGLRLNLWPIGLIMGRALSVGTAWRLMRKATRGLLLGYLVYMIPFAFVMAANWGDLSAGRTPGGWGQGLFVIVGAAYGIAAYAMSAVLYELRVENPATVADVFD